MTNRGKIDQAIMQLAARYDCMGEGYAFIKRERSLAEFYAWLQVHKQAQRRIGKQRQRFANPY